MHDEPIDGLISCTGGCLLWCCVALGAIVIIAQIIKAVWK